MNKRQRKKQAKKREYQEIRLLDLAMRISRARGKTLEQIDRSIFKARPNAE